MDLFYDQGKPAGRGVGGYCFVVFLRKGLIFPRARTRRLPFFWGLAWLASSDADGSSGVAAGRVRTGAGTAAAGSGAATATAGGADGVAGAGAVGVTSPPVTRIE